MLNFHKKYWLFLMATLLAALYILEPFSPIVIPIVDFKLEFAPIISVRNALALLFVFMWYKIFTAGR